MVHKNIILNKLRTKIREHGDYTNMSNQTVTFIHLLGSSFIEEHQCKLYKYIKTERNQQWSFKKNEMVLKWILEENPKQMAKLSIDRFM